MEEEKFYKACTAAASAALCSETTHLRAHQKTHLLKKKNLVSQYTNSQESRPRDYRILHHEFQKIPPNMLTWNDKNNIFCLLQSHSYGFFLDIWLKCHDTS